MTETDKIVGLKFDRWTVVSVDSSRPRAVLCFCACTPNEQVSVLAEMLTAKKSRSCGCLKIEMSRRFSPGDQVGALTVLGYLTVKTKSVYLKPLVACVCSCDDDLIIVRSEYLIKAKERSSCGCVLRQQRIQRLLDTLPQGESGFNAVLSSYASNAKDHDRKWELSRAQFRFLVTQNCFYCALPPSQIARGDYEHSKFVHSGVDRVDNDQNYLPSNCVSCCTICNMAKRTLSFLEFAAYVQRQREYGKGSPYMDPATVLMEWRNKHSEVTATLIEIG